MPALAGEIKNTLTTADCRPQQPAACRRLASCDPLLRWS